MSKKIVDLTLELHADMLWPTAPALILFEKYNHKFSALRYRNIEGAAAKIIVCGDHAGTHVDAPFHVYPNKATIERVPIEAFTGSAVLIDVSPFKKTDELITEEILQKAVREQSIEIKEGDIILVRAWPGKRSESGYFDSRGFSKGGAEWLREKKPKAVGTDLSSFDYGQEMREGKYDRSAHMVLLGANIVLFESLTNLDEIKKTRFQFIGLPLKIRGATASPVRAVAIIE